MTITHVNTQFGAPKHSGTPAITSTSVVTKPTGLAVGDVMVAFVNANKAGITAPSVRWTRLSTNDSAANLYRFEVWYCVSTSSETAASSFTWTNADSSSPMWAAIAAYRGVSQSSPINTSSVDTGTTAASQNTPVLATTAPALILRARTVRCSSGTRTFSSVLPVERFDDGNNGTVGYFGALYDDDTTMQPAGSIIAISITGSGGTQTDTFATAIALTVGDVNVAAGVAAATVSVKTATAAAGQSATAGLAAATVSTKQPQVLSGKVVNSVGVAQATAAVPDVIHYVRVGTGGSATAAAYMPTLFFGTPSWRTKVVPADTWQGRYGIPQRRMIVGQD